MCETIYKTKVISLLIMRAEFAANDDIHDELSILTNKIKDMPVVDAVPVVRCKVCLKKRLCSLYRETNQENGFCAWGVIEE